MKTSSDASTLTTAESTPSWILISSSPRVSTVFSPSITGTPSISSLSPTKLPPIYSSSAGPVTKLSTAPTVISSQAPVLTTTEATLGHNEILALINETHALIDETNARINETQSLIDETQAQIDETNARINETQALIEETQAHTEHVGGVADKIEEILASDRSDRDVFSHSCTEVANVITDFRSA